MAAAGAILVTVGLTYKNPSTTGALGSEIVPTKHVRITQQTAVPSVSGGTQTIGFATHEAIDISELTTLGVGYLENMDATNFVQIGVDVGGTFYPLVDIDAGEAYPMRFTPGVTIYAQADTGDVVLKKKILDD